LAASNAISIAFTSAKKSKRADRRALEEEKDVKTAIGAARAKQARKEML
jgi:hypothetical protein